MEVKHNIQLRDVIQDRIALTGVSQAKLSETISTTPAQLSLYLRGKASLNNEALESLISALDINVASYNKRFQLAKDIAHFFNVEKVPMNVVLKMKHEDMILTTGKAELKYLVDVNAEEFKYIVASGIIDFEGTYPFFRVMVAQLMNVGEKPTAKTITESILEVAKKLETILKANGTKNVVLADLAKDDWAEAVANAFKFSKLVVASSSYNAGLFPPMEQFLRRLKERNYQKREVAIIENGSWAPSAGKCMKDLLQGMKDIEIVEPVVTIKSRMKTENLVELEELARKLK